MVDAGTGRSVPDRALEAVERLGVPFRGRLDAAIRQIAHPPVQTFSSRRRFGEVSEADALDAATDQESSRAAHGPAIIACRAARVGRVGRVGLVGQVRKTRPRPPYPPYLPQLPYPAY